MVAKGLLILAVLALIYGGFMALSPGSSLFAPADPTQKASWSADRTRDAHQEAVRQENQEAQRLANEIHQQETLDARQARLDSEKRALEETSQARRAESTRLVQADIATAEATRQLATIAAQETASQRLWIAQGWTATADSIQSASRATLDQAAALRQETADAAAVQALQTAQNAQALVAEQKAEQERIATERLKIRQGFDAWAPYLIGLVVGAIVVAGAWYWRRHQVLQRGPDGRLPGMRVGDAIVDPERAVLPVTHPKAPVQAPLAAHMQITENHQKTQALTQLQGKGSPAQALNLIRSAPAAQPAANDNGSGDHVAPARWALFAHDSSPSIPLGVGPNGSLQSPDIEEYPHRLYAGITGGGKSRYGLRPNVAGALGRGWVVVLVGDRAPVDYKIFAVHPNYHPLILDEPAQALPVLAAINREIRARWDQLYDKGASTWSRLAGAGPRVLVVFDEFAALYDDLDSRERAEFVRQVTNVSRLARKAGIHLAVGVQNPTADNIRPSIRRNMLPVAFKVVDQVASRVILEEIGAEQLIPPQYMMRTTGVWQGVGFDPSDEEVGNYLAGRRVPVYDPPAFLSALPAPGERGLLDAPDPEIERLAEELRPLWEKGANKSELARSKGWPAGGAFWERISKAVELLERSTRSTRSTTSTSTTQLPQVGPV